jgi:hypothetical protein
MYQTVRRRVSAALVIAFLCVVVAAQQQTPRDASSISSTAQRATPPAISGAQNAGANVDENFELNITERRITERDFFASTAIETETDAARGLSLRVGVAVGASEIDVLLRNVRGSVRFRASLGALHRVLDAHRETNAAPPQSVP